MITLDKNLLVKDVCCSVNSNIPVWSGLIETPTSPKPPTASSVKSEFCSMLAKLSATPVIFCSRKTNSTSLLE